MKTTYAILMEDGRRVDFGTEQPYWETHDDLFIRYANGPLAGQTIRPSDRLVVSNGKLDAVMPPHFG